MRTNNTQRTLCNAALSIGLATSVLALVDTGAVTFLHEK
jgi:hypothetical protein